MTNLFDQAVYLSENANARKLYDGLHSDNVVGWEENNYQHRYLLDDWLHDNIVHALESCPRVLKHWNERTHSNSKGSVLCRALGMALEGLSDNIKVDILSGKGVSKAQEELTLQIKKRASNWMYLSPTWAGGPKSDLRRQAVHMGWSNSKLFSQVPRSISQPEAARWNKWVPYAHSILVFYRADEVVHGRMYAIEGESAATEETGQAWARVEDIALAQSLIKHNPDCGHTLTPHSSALPVPIELQERMDAFVAAYEGLGMMAALKEMVLAGNVPAMCDDMAMELPSLGELGL